MFKKSLLLALILSLIFTFIPVVSLAAPNTDIAAGVSHGIDYYGSNYSALTFGWWDFAALASDGYSAGNIPFTANGTDQASKVASNLIYDVIAGSDTSANVALLNAFYINNKYGTTANDEIWSIIALEMAGAPYNKANAAAAVLSYQNTDGGFSFAGTTSDADMTGMALVALNMLKNETGVPLAITKSIDLLKQIQDTATAGFKDRDYPEYSYVGSVNPNSTAAAVIGLIDIGEDILSGEWVKNGKTMADALLSFKLSSGGYFAPFAPNSCNKLALSQTVVALSAVINDASVFTNIPDLTKTITPPAVLPTATPGASLSASIKVIGKDGFLLETDENYKTFGTTALDALSIFLDENDIPFEIEDTAWGKSIKSINAQAPFSDGYWAFAVNNVPAQVGCDSYTLNENDEILFYYDGYDIKTNSPANGGTLTLTINRLGYDYSTGQQTSSPVNGAAVTYNGASLTTLEGTAEFTALDTVLTLDVSITTTADPALWADFSAVIDILYFRNMAIKILGIDDFSLETEENYSTLKTTALDAVTEFLDVSLIEYEIETSAFGSYIKSINGQDPSDKSGYFVFYVNNQMSMVGLDTYVLASGDTVLLAYDGYDIVVDEATSGESFNTSIKRYGYDSLVSLQTVLPIENASVTYNNEILTTDENGSVSFLAANTTSDLVINISTATDPLLWTNFSFTKSIVPGKLVTIKILGVNNLEINTPAGYKTTKANALEALLEFGETNGFEVLLESTAYGDYVKSIAGQTPETCSYFAFMVNGQMSMSGPSDYALLSGDTLLFYYEGFYANIMGSQPMVGKTFKIEVNKITYNSLNDTIDYKPITGASAKYNNTTKASNASGQVSFTAVTGNRNVDVTIAKEKDSALYEDFKQSVPVAPTTGGGSGGESSDPYVYLTVTGYNSVFYKKASVALQQGDNPHTVLNRNVTNVVTTGSGDTLYVSSIKNLAEFDHGVESGWKFKINGDVKPASCSLYTLKKGDDVEWFYVTDSTETTSSYSGGGTSKTPSPSSTPSTETLSPANTPSSPNVTYTPLSEKKALSLLNKNIDGFMPLLLAGINLTPSKEMQDMLNENIYTNKGIYRKVTDLERTIINVVMQGLDPENIGGVNLIQKLVNHENIRMQGLNGVAFALIALDLASPKGTYTGANTKDFLIELLQKSQNPDGGFSLDGGGSDVDITAFALTALANHINRADIKTAVEKGFKYLDSVKTSDNNYANADGDKNLESLAWVIIAKCANRINAQNDISALNSFELESGFYEHIKGDGQNTMATEQALMAILAFEKYAKNSGSIFKISKPLPFNDFGDISDWAAEFVEEAYEKGIVKGDDNKNFNPKQNLTRAELVTMLLRAVNIEQNSAAEEKFSDVKKDDWFFGYVMKAYELDFVRGLSEESFNPGGYVTRQDMAVIAARILKLTKTGEKPADINDASDYAKASIELVFTAKIIEGDGTNIFPKQNLTREQAVKTVLLISKNYK